MPQDPRVRELLAQWEVARGQAARPPTAEELCKDCPELLPVVRGEIARRQREQSLAETVADPVVHGVNAAPSGILPSVPGYELIEEIGRGGMGVVYKARDLKLDRPVALKMILAGAHASAKALKRFDFEAQAVTKLQHPNVVQIFDRGVQDGCPYFVVEFVNGGNLDHVLAEGPIEPRESALLLEPLARALHHAHAHGVIHRDLKPANVLLHLPEGSTPTTREERLRLCVPKLTDFGLAKELTSPTRLTRTGVAIGTPSYMAPEQALAQNDRIGPATDVYGLGALLYEMLHGRPPFDAPSDLEVLQAVVHNPPGFDDHPNEPDWLQIKAICLQCLTKEPEDRYPSALALAEDLQRFLWSQPVLARAPRWRPPTWVLMTAVSVLLVVGMGVAEFAWLKPYPPGVMTGVLAAVLAGAGLFHRRRRHRPAPPSSPAPTPLRVSPEISTTSPLPPLKVGVLHSLSGTMSVSETPVSEAVMLAIEAVNQAGGVLGRKIEAVVADGRSDPAAFLREAELLIKKEQVCVVFGCWTSACRRTIRPLFEDHDHLLMYPVQYEGLEQSPNIFYLGSTPSQQILPTVEWCLTRLRKRRFFLVGSDYVYPHAVAAILRPALLRLGGEIVGEVHVPLGGIEMGPLVERIRAVAPEVILNLLNGDSNLPFFRALRKAGVTPRSVPTISFSIAEHELRTLGLADMAGDYAAWSYFQSVHTPENKAFLARLRDRFGPLRVATDPMETAWCAVHLWAQAVAEAGVETPSAVRARLRGQSYRGPGGTVRIDPETQNVWKVARIGRVRVDGQFDVVWSSDAPLPPLPYPDGRSREEWQALLEDMSRRWGGQWANPAT